MLSAEQSDVVDGAPAETIEVSKRFMGFHHDSATSVFPQKFGQAPTITRPVLNYLTRSWKTMMLRIE
jgi:hypothetical protein